MSGRVEGAERVRTVEQTGGRGPRGTDKRTGRRGADRAQHARTDGRADKRSGGRADWAVGASIARTVGRADEEVGLGLKGHIPRGWVHFWAPSLLASSECECARCLGVQWGPVRFHVKHPYLAPGLTCLV